MSGYEALLADSVKLISLPDIYLRTRVVLNDPDSSAGELGEVLMVDPGLTARVLRLANSSFYGFRAKVETITRAVTLLGRQQIHDVVLATSVARAFSGVDIETMDVSRFWRESVYTALVSRIVAKLCNVLDSERLFVHGLMRDLGHLIMYQKIPDLARQALEVAQAEARLITHVEQELIGYDYTQVGGELLRIWDMPPAMQGSVRWHMEPAAADEHLLDASIVHIAALLTTEIDSLQDVDLLTLPFSPDALGVTHVSEDTLLKVRMEAHSYLDEACQYLLPGNMSGASVGA
ncbi:MAG: HDOD domain-containing protein [Gammaproteobacteria bacterium]|nr:HDOD domain-containing protein [Gammaproteobacteria bacterium]